MKFWLFLRGEWDENNRQSAEDNSDMWLQLFRNLAGTDNYHIWYKDKKSKIDFNKVTHVFSRGGHKWQDEIVKKCKGAFSVYYGAGIRTIPKKNLYNLILVDCKSDLEKCKKKYPNSKTEMWFKPAAEHFKPLKYEKKYDLCYVANCHSKFQEKIKRVEWIYKTIPKDLKMLHLGQSSIKPPKNIEVKKVPRKVMPEFINQCRLGLAPYTDYDSAPRVVSELLACDVPVLTREDLRINWKMSPHFLIKSTKENFWTDARLMLETLKEKMIADGLPCTPTTEFLFFKIEGYVNVENAALYLNFLIDEKGCV